MKTPMQNYKAASAAYDAALAELTKLTTASGSEVIEKAFARIETVRRNFLECQQAATIAR